MKKKEVIKWLTVVLALLGVLTQSGVVPPVVGEAAGALLPVVVGRV